MADVPFIVIGGYLGAGKTTLINRVLASDHGRRFGVLVNDFGDINIDAKLIQGNDGPLISLVNGCVCCQLGNELGSGIETLLNIAPRLDALLVETSGVAYPGKIASYAKTWPGLSPGGTLVIADANRIRQLSQDKFVGPLVTEQLRQADQVLITKLIDGSEWQSLRRWIQEQAAGVSVVQSSEFASHGVFEIQELNHSQVIVGDVVFDTKSFSASNSLDPNDLNRWLVGLPPEIHRVKGIFYNARDTKHRWVVQGVGRQTTLSRGEPWGESPKRTEIVLIWPKSSTPRIPDGILG
ncbi:MAG: CobW family GTP-binding protein [Pseudomonadota bacterium]|nr:CobW family GTP-binding protein [Pseudomonadota bacterium]